MRGLELALPQERGIRGRDFGRVCRGWGNQEARSRTVVHDDRELDELRHVEACVAVGRRDQPLRGGEGARRRCDSAYPHSSRGAVRFRGLLATGIVVTCLRQWLVVGCW